MLPPRRKRSLGAFHASEAAHAPRGAARCLRECRAARRAHAKDRAALAAKDAALAAKETALTAKDAALDAKEAALATKEAALGAALSQRCVVALTPDLVKVVARATLAELRSDLIVVRRGLEAPSDLVGLESSDAQLGAQSVTPLLT